MVAPVCTVIRGLYLSRMKIVATLFAKDMGFRSRYSIQTSPCSSSNLDINTLSTVY